MSAARPPDSARSTAFAAALLEFLEAHTGRRGLRYAELPTPLSGGFWAELFSFELADPPPELEGELVIRVMPDVPRSRREIAIHDAVTTQGFAAPRMRMSRADGALLGRPFIVMDRVRGGSLSSGLGVIETSRFLGGMPFALAGIMGRLHALDPILVREALAKRGWSSESGGVDEVLTMIRNVIERRDLSGFATAFGWLRDHRPSPKRLVVCHGDLHPLNVIVSAGEVTALVDWTNACLADPEFDVARTAQLLAQWPFPVPHLPRWAMERIGRRAARQFLGAYDSRMPLDRSCLPWYEALQSLALLVRVAAVRLAATTTVPRTSPIEVIAQANLECFVRVSGIRPALPPRPGR